ncbi:MAG: glycosyltransferase family 4 protein [Chloroflexi bacterium]|nr:glycosyltransferase family 4 protein [Chloroflexota bacterium]
MYIAHFANTYKANVNGVVKSVSIFRDALAGIGNNVFIFARHARRYE